MIAALRSFDYLYPQPNEESALEQYQIQLSQPLPYDLEKLNLDEYKNLALSHGQRLLCHAASLFLFGG